MMRAAVIRALVLTEAFAAASTLVTCLGENSKPLQAKATKELPAKATKELPAKATKELPAKATKELPAKATKELPAELLSLLRQKNMPKQSPILLRVFKEEAELEVWKQDTTGRFQLLKLYP